MRMEHSENFKAVLEEKTRETESIIAARRIVSFFHTPNVTAFGSSAPSSGECEEQPLSRRRLNASSMNVESRQDLFICVSSHKSPFQPVFSPR